MLEVDLASVETNIVFFNVKANAKVTAQELSDKLKEKGVLALAVGANRLRIVIHYMISEEDMLFTAAAIASIVC